MVVSDLPQVEGAQLALISGSAVPELQELLARHGGHRERAANELGISRRALTFRLQRTGLTRVRQPR